MLNDELIDEVRAIRHAHAARFACDLRAIYADLKRSEAERIAAGHPFVSPLHLTFPRPTLHCSRLASLTAEFER
jgi:hypothetical protein